MQKVNLSSPPDVARLGKDKIIEYERIIDSWKSDIDLVKTLLDHVSELAERIWIPCSDLLEEWEIGEVEESLEAVGSVMTKIEAVNQVRTASVRDIEDLVVLDAKAI